MPNAFIPTGEIRPPKKGEHFLCPITLGVVGAVIDFTEPEQIYRAVDWDSRIAAEKRLAFICGEIIDAGILQDVDHDELSEALEDAKEAGIGQ